MSYVKYELIIFKAGRESGRKDEWIYNMWVSVL